MNETELLFTRVLNCQRQSLYLDKGLELNKKQAGFIAACLKRRISGEPIQYILGNTEFMGFDFNVSPGCLIPRPETEILIETAINCVKCLSPVKPRILEIGTGSGCIAVSLAKLLKNVLITATDISQKALDIAKSNALLNKVSDRIVFLNSDLFSSLPTCDKPYALCISNPPYIPSAEIQDLQPELQYEPRIALDGGIDGLDFYRRIIMQSADYLKPGGFLIMEMGFGQCKKVKEIFKISENFEIIKIVKDYSNIDRVVVAKINSK
ncbi:MAG: peptide chain release factor N(5)-glutamine methyltransferase [Candidatus Omnitrophica bacterium]|nr:peptide chain release factor N(5)-glutamine methyltransferase [Candidatus Omnitrophota bacterium]